MTSPTNPQNNTDAASPTAGYDFDALAKKDSAELAPDEAEALAYWRSEQSLREYNPDDVAPEDRVVELPDHASVTLGELVADESQPANLRAEAQTTLADLKGETVPESERIDVVESGQAAPSDAVGGPDAPADTTTDTSSKSSTSSSSKTDSSK